MPAFRVSSTTGTPTSACFNTPTICSTLKRFFLISKISFQILPKTNIPPGSEIPGPISDRTISPDLERWYAKRADSHTVEVAGASHSVYVSHPKEVADVIESAARAVSK